MRKGLGLSFGIARYDVAAAMEVCGSAMTDKEKTQSVVFEVGKLEREKRGMGFLTF